MRANVRLARSKLTAITDSENCVKKYTVKVVQQTVFAQVSMSKIPSQEGVQSRF